MRGMNAEHGGSLNGIEHLMQSIRDILSTPLGSRVMRRDYGSRLFELIDNPTNSETLIEVYAATAEALDRWEPRFRLRQVGVDSAAPGHLSLWLLGRYLPNGQELRLDGVIVS